MLLCLLIAAVRPALATDEPPSAPAEPRFAVGTLSQMEAFNASPQARLLQSPLHERGDDLPPRGLGRQHAGAAAPLQADADRSLEPGHEPGNWLADAPPLATSFIGQTDNNTTIPPDTMGAVGPSHVFSMLNSGRTIYNKSGGLVSAQISLASFFSALGTGIGQPARSPFDPRVEYDQYDNRWVAACVGFANDGSATAWLLVAMSQTNNPTGAWNLYAIPIHVGVHVGHWLDFPGLGLDYHNVVITGNVFVQGGGSVHADTYVISKASLMAGAGPLVLGVDYSLFHSPCGSGGLNGFSFQPCHTYGQTSGNSVNYLMDQGWYDTGLPTLRFIRVTTVNGIGAAATLDCMGDQNFVLVNGYNFNRLDATQPGGCSAINTNDTRLRDRGVVRNGKIFFTHHVGNGAPAATPSPPATRAEVRWYEVDPAAVVSPGLPNQQGAIGHATLAYYFPSIAVSGSECVMLGFSASDASTFAGGYYTARNAGDAPGTMQSVSTLKVGEDTYLKRFGGTRNRWGDYSATCIDPVDDSIWTIQEYARPEVGGNCPTADTGRWGTWWGRIACCPTITLTPALLPGATIGDAYSQALTPSAGTPPFSFSVVSGSMPPGITLSLAGVISGTPSSTVGVFNFGVKVTDAAGCMGTQLFSLVVLCNLPGDVNDDGAIDGDDVRHFVDCLLTGTTVGGHCGCADMDGDGDVDPLDLGLFINALL